MKKSVDVKLGMDSYILSLSEIQIDSDRYNELSINLLNKENNIIYRYPDEIQESVK